jgi:CheY-like chemotaxis protein
VLLVEDNADSRDFLRAMLVACGATVEAAGSVDEALARWSARHVDLILSDLGMPGRDGIDLIAEVRAAERSGGRQRVAGIALTAHAGEADRQSALDAGFDLVVTKPVAPDALCQMMVRLLKPPSASG